jgi:hypothetical protein
MPEPRKVHDEAEARVLLDELELLELPLVDLCRERGISARSLNCWRRNLARRDRSTAPAAPAAPAAPLRFVELVRPAPAPRPPAAGYRLVVGDVAIEVPADFDPPALTRLLAAVRAC